MKKILFIILVLIIPFKTTFATNININNIKNQETHKLFISKLEKKYSDDKQLIYLEKLNKKLNEVVSIKKLTDEKQDFVEDILKLNNEKIFEINLKEKKDTKQQEFKEQLYIKKLQKTLKNSPDTFVNNILSNKIKLITVNDKMDFIEENKIKRIVFTKYYDLNENNYKKFSNKSWYIINKSWTDIFWFIENYSFEEKIPYSEISNHLKLSLNSSTNFSLEGENYYIYDFENYSYIKDGYWVYLSDLESAFWDLKQVITYQDDTWSYKFINKYQKVKLIKSDLIFWVTDKIKFLEYLIDDKKNLSEDTDQLFENLKEITINLTNWKKKSEKIKNIYAYILENVEYPKKFSLDDDKIYSWILTYQNKSWVCLWYTKLMSYMLMFAGVQNSVMIKWNVIDAQDFPNIGHVWLRIGEYYYDPTFDDPIWTNNTKDFSQYKYYKLPYDIMYTNRYTYRSLPNSLKTETIEYRKDLVNKNLFELVTKYENEDYLLLRPLKFKKQNNIPYDEEIKVEHLKNIIEYWKVDNFTFKGKSIKKLMYFSINQNNISAILEQSEYNLEWYYLFKWKLEDWSYEYRLAYDVEF